MRYYIRYLQLVALLAFAEFCSSQVVLQPIAPRLGIVQRTQLWNILVINSMPSEIEATVTMTLRDRQTGNTLFSAGSGVIKLTKGSKQLNEQALFPIQYQYDATFNDLSQQKVLPAGNYLACYLVVSIKGDELAKECISIDVSPMSRPMLIYPQNGSEIVERSPQFSWIPPMPLAIFNKLRYDLVVTELLPNQTAEDAIRQNPPLFANGHLRQQSMAYPASAMRLDSSKQYAWQVIARNGDSYAEKSEAWTFRLRPPNKLEEVLSMTPYVSMKKEGAEITIAPNGILKFGYFNQTNEPVVFLKITDLTENLKENLPSLTINIQPGQNFLQSNLKKAFNPVSGHIYLAQIENSLKEIYILRFELKEIKED